MRRASKQGISLIHWTGPAALVVATALLIVACGGSSGDITPEPQNVRVTVEEVINTVETERRRSTGSIEADFRSAQPGQDLIPGDQVKTFRDSEARIDIVVLDHLRIARTKSDTLWRLGQFSVDENTIIELDQGKIFVFDDGFREGHPTIDVVTPAGTATARGTWISVGYSPQTGEAEVQCFRGLCELANVLGSVLLTDQQKSRATIQTVPTDPEPMDEDDIKEFRQLPEALSGEVVIPPPLAPQATPTSTAVPSAATSVAPTFVPPTPTLAPPTATTAPPTATPAPEPVFTDVSGAWNTTYGTMVLDQDNSAVSGTYTTDNGVIVEATISGGTLTGFWVEDASGTNCGSAKDGRNFWGRITFEFNEDFTSFEGKWRWCEQDPTENWHGTRTKGP